jgi:hypothetical protein
MNFRTDHLGSARGSRAGDGGLAIPNFFDHDYEQEHEQE